MASLVDAEWRLDYPGTSYNFGTGATPVWNLVAPDLGDYAIRTDDADNPRSDGTSFGEDFFGGRAITFELGIRGPSETAIRAELGTLGRHWRADTVRRTPGATAMLTARYRGVERVVFGRPRRFAPSAKDIHTGLGTAVADFVCADERFYGVELNQASVSIVPAPGGGLIGPLASPLTTTESSDRSTGFRVDSELPVWPVITIQGPITNPTVEVVGLWKMTFDITLAYDQSLVIDTQPWARTIRRNGASVPGTISRQSVRLSRAAIPAGSWEWALRGTSETNTATATIRWRDAFTTL